MSEILENIVNCSISIEAPLAEGDSFSRILLVGSGPLVGKEDLKELDGYASLQEVLDAGWEEESKMCKAAAAAFMQESKPDMLYIAIRKNVEGTKEKVTETVRRAMEMPGWYGLALVDADASEGDYDEVAELIETTEKIFAFSTQELHNPVTNKVYMRTFGIYSEDEFAHVAWMAKTFSFDPGSETWAFKTLSGVQASEIPARTIRELEEERLNCYITCAGRDITQGGKMVGGEWIDVIRFRDWIKNQMQMKIYELFIRNPKIPYLDSGIALVENQMEAVLASGQRAGGIADTEYDKDGNPIYGYIVTVPKAASLTSTQRAERKLKGCYFTARLSGAIHVVELKGNLNF